MSGKKTLRIVVIVQSLDGSQRRLNIHGRDAWALRELVNAGKRGVTPIETPGPRWSGYVYNLRRMGLDIETVHEGHSGPFPGRHARYVLHSDVRLIEPDQTSEAA